MVRASNLLEGITAPMCSGFSIHERRKRTSSSRRRGFFWTRREDCKGISLPDGVSRTRHTGIDQWEIGQANESVSRCRSRASKAGSGARAKEILDLGEE